MSSRRRLTDAALAVGLVLVLGACVPFCGIGGKFTLSNASVDSSFNCPNPADNFPYDVHGTMNAHNSTTSTVTIRSMSEQNVTVNTVGSWTGPRGEKGGGPITTFSPKSVASGATATIHFSIPFRCTNSGPTVTTYGEFTFKFHVVTSAGSYSLDGSNRHRLVITG
jgi:hypothetical protein